MKILLIGDTHGNWKVLYKILNLEKPSLLIHCGDWGTSRLEDSKRFKIFVEKAKIPIVSIYGNHDSIETIRNLRAKNYYWLPNFIPRKIKGFRFLGINGNIAGRIRNPWHITEEIIREELRLCLLAKPKTLDFIVSHECPKGYGDIIKSRARDKTGKSLWRKNVGAKSLFEVLDKLRPKFYLCGHIHFPQIARYKETVVFNAGYGVKGNYMILDTSKDYKEGYAFLSLFRRLKDDEVF